MTGEADCPPCSGPWKVTVQNSPSPTLALILADHHKERTDLLAELSRLHQDYAAAVTELDQRDGTHLWTVQAGSVAGWRAFDKARSEIDAKSGGRS